MSSGEGKNAIRLFRDIVIKETDEGVQVRSVVSSSFGTPMSVN